MNDGFLKERQKFKAAIMQRFGMSDSMYTETTELLAPIATAARFRKGQYLQRTGVPARYLFWLTSGVARIGFASPSGEDVTLRFSQEGNSATSHDLLSPPGTAATFFIIAETPIECYRFEWNTLLGVRAQHEVAEKYHSMMILQYAKEREISYSANMTASARDRVAAFRRDYPGLEARISQKAIASYLRITPQYLSQLLQQEKSES